MSQALEELKRSVHAALETYSNVHRGSGHHSMATTRLYEHARMVVLEHLGLKPGSHKVIFGSPRTIASLQAQLRSSDSRCLSSEDLGLPLGVRALVVQRKALSRLAHFQSGGGTARLVGEGWVVWAKSPGRFEPGTPSIVNIIAFARALQLSKRHGEDCFRQAWVKGLGAHDILDLEPLAGLSGRGLLAAFKAGRIGRDLQVPTAQGLSPLINFDNGASTPSFEPIWEAVWKSWQLPPQARPALAEKAAAVCADFLHAPASDYDLIFTSNTTEAINIAAESLGLQPKDGVEPVVVNTVLEHNSNELPWRQLPGIAHIQLPVDAKGFVGLGAFEDLLKEYNEDPQHGAQRIRLFAVSGASNVLGTFNDLAAICQIAHRYQVRVLVDAAQLVAHRKVDMLADGIDYLAFSAHKAYAPFGTGVLAARKGLLAFDPARLEEIKASGAENSAGLAGLATSLGLLRRIGLDLIQEEEQALTAQALNALAKIPGLKIHGIKTSKAPGFSQRGGVISFELKKAISYKIANELAERAGIGTRWGCHCAHMMIKRALGVGPKLQKFQRAIVTVFPKLELPGVARVSFGLGNEAGDVDVLAGILGKIEDEGSLKRKELRTKMDQFAAGKLAEVFSATIARAT